jgi:PleD family two-component response regulator
MGKLPSAVAAIKSGEDLDPEKLTKRADDALYNSKRNGRNQVSFSQ